jgi:hypothetical protein
LGLAVKINSLCRSLLAAYFFLGSLALAQPRLQVLRGHVRPSVLSGKAALAGPMDPATRLNLSIVLPLRNQAALTSLLARLYDPSSPDYRQFLSQAQFTQQFGPDPADYDAVVRFAQAGGFTVGRTPANRLVVPISGTAAQVERAFNLKMGRRSTWTCRLRTSPAWITIRFPSRW